MPKTGDEATAPDLVVLSVLSHGPMHGYGLNQELIRCDVEDWAGISPPQVYYSLRKLYGKGWIRSHPGDKAARGPDRDTYEVTKSGLAVLKRSLSRLSWATKRPPNPFQTWLALAHHADGRARRRVVEARRQFLVAEIDKEKRTLIAIKSETGSADCVAYHMVSLAIRHFRTELSWLADIERVLAR